jgi:UDP-N-acetylglucosamine acyltransferase
LKGQKVVRIHPSAVVDPSVRLGADVVIGPNCVVAANAVIGDATVLDANVVIGPNVRIGSQNRLFANCAVGNLPQVLSLKPESPVGILVIGDRNTIREQVTIHPAMSPGSTTSVGSDNLLMIGVHIGHDCTIEDKAVMSNYVQVSGHCKIETGAWLSGMVQLHQFVTVGRWCYAAGFAGLNHDVPPFLIVSGHYPPLIRGVNERGLARAGISQQSRRRIVEAYKRLYRQGGTLLANASALAAENDLDENVATMVEAIRNSSKHRFGRYLETFRDRGGH